MFLTVHAATGVIIGQSFNSPYLAFVFGVIFHFVLDMVPHGDQNLINKERKDKIRIMAGIASIDAVVMGIFLSFVYSFGLNLNYLPIVFGVVGSILPDFFVGLNEVTHGRIKLLKKIYEFHFHLHYFHLFEKFKPNLKTGLTFQYIILIVLTSIIL